MTMNAVVIIWRAIKIVRAIKKKNDAENEANYIRSKRFTKNKREKFKICISILEKCIICLALKITKYFRCTNVIFVDILAVPLFYKGTK